MYVFQKIVRLDSDIFLFIFSAAGIISISVPMEAWLMSRISFQMTLH